jgi:hypothetical protein
MLHVSEAQLLADILLAHSRGNVRLWRQNSGTAWQGRIVSQDHSRLVLSPYYAIKLAPEGTSDIGGLVSEIITADMVGRSIAVYTGIEGKTKTGRVSPAQQAFLDMVLKMGGRAGIARSVEDARRILGEL